MIRKTSGPLALRHSKAESSQNSTGIEGTMNNATHDHVTVVGLDGRCIHGLSRTHGGVSCGKQAEHEVHAATVDLAELTSRLKLEPSEQQTVAAFANGAGPWTEHTARTIIEVWHTTENIDA